MLALTRDHEPRAVAAIASRFNRVEPSHGQEAFASASTASPQLACRLAAPPGHESGLTPDTNRHEKLGVSTRGSGVRSWREELFSFPVPHSCSLRGRRIRVRRRPHSCRGHQTQTEGRGGTETTCEGRLGEWVSCVWGEWRSWQAAFKQRRLRAVSRGQAARLMRRVSWSRVSANRICRHIWNSICEIAAMPTCRAFVHKSLGTPGGNLRRAVKSRKRASVWYNMRHDECLQLADAQGRGAQAP